MSANVRRSLSPFVMALGLAAAWHVALAAALQPSPRPSPAPRPPAPTLTYRPGAAALDESDLRQPGWVALHSPLLFARPSPVGFQALRKHPERLPSLDPPEWPRRLLPRPADPITEAATLLPPGLEYSARQRLADLAAVAQPPPPRLPTGRAEWTVFGLEAEAMPALEFPLGPDQRGPSPWTAHAVLTVGSDGRPCRILLDEPPAADGLSEALVAGLYRWRFPPAAAGRRVQASLSYEGRPAPAPVTEAP